MKGHLFCKSCIIENLYKQKKQHDNDFKRFEKDQIDKALINKAEKEH